MTPRTEAAWLAVEADDTFTDGIQYRLCDPAIKADVFAGISKSAGVAERFLAFGLAAPFQLRSEHALGLNDLRLDLRPDPLNPGRQLLLLALLDPTLSDPFGLVCEDLLEQVAGVAGQEQLLQAVFQRLETWKALFVGRSSEGLSRESRQGLFGELTFLQKLLEHGLPAASCVRCWSGPSGAVHDFQLQGQAVEIKTSAAANPQHFHISNERQLDEGTLTNLYIGFFSLSVTPDHGQTLNQLIDSITGLLNTSPAAQRQFRLRLYEVGYFPHQRQLYDQPGYQVQREEYFRVTSGFPRLREADIPPGVGEVRYTVALGACRPFGVAAATVFDNLKATE